MESGRNQPVVGIIGRIVGVACKPVVVAVVGKIPGGFVIVGIDDHECLLLLHCLEGVQVGIVLDGHAIAIAHNSCTLRSTLSFQTGLHGGVMSHFLDGCFLFVLYFGHSSGFLSLGLHDGIPLLVGRCRLHGRRIGLNGACVNFLEGQVLHLPQSVMSGLGLPGGQVH